jgi:hypothetical protein
MYKIEKRYNTRYYLFNGYRLYSIWDADTIKVFDNILFLKGIKLIKNKEMDISEELYDLLVRYV